MKKLLIIGSTVADIIVNLERLPVTAEDVNIDSQQMSLGGCAYNVSEMVRHFGVPYLLFSPIGTGIYGDFIRNRLAEKGLASPVPTPDQPNGCCYCFVEKTGERTFVCDHGAEYLFRRQWFNNIKINNISARYICGLEIEDKTGSVIVDFLEKHSDIPVFFAPGPRINFIDSVLMKRIFALRPVLHLNREETCSYSGENDIESGARNLYSITKNTVIITDGSQGAFYFDGEELIHVGPVKASQIVDTIGAGDAHMGAVMACLAKGMTMYQAIQKANAAASLVVSREGATLIDDEFIL